MINRVMTFVYNYTMKYGRKPEILLLTKHEVDTIRHTWKDTIAHDVSPGDIRSEIRIMGIPIYISERSDIE